MFNPLKLDLNVDFYLCVPQVSAVCVLQSTLSVCVLSVDKHGKRHAVGRVLFPLEGELGQAGRVLWRDLDPEEETQVKHKKRMNTTCWVSCSITEARIVLLSDPLQCSELGDVQVSLSYSPSLQCLSVAVLKARGLQLLTDSGFQAF